jgi:Ser/Thr protein kinase RdoA (MazF antagonist)
MRPYDDLTEQGKIRRLHSLARRALERYDVDPVRLRCIARDTNTTFRIDTTDGRTMALRIQADDPETESHVETELAWLKALAESGLPVVGVMAATDGSASVEVEVAGVPRVRTCVLFSWIRGTTLGETSTPEEYRSLGVLSARLHDHGETWSVPAGLGALVWDKVFYYPTEPVVLYEPRFAKHMTPERCRVVRAVEKKADAELARIHREVPVFPLHGDLHPWNVHRTGDGLTVFDFNDVMIGAPVQDIAITLFYNREEPQYPDLRAAFEEGYRTVRTWPVTSEDQVELLMGARTVNFINYVLRLNLDPDDHIPRMTKRIERVL